MRSRGRISGGPVRRAIFVASSAVFLALWGFTGVTLAMEPREQRGLTFAKTNCAGCHAVGRSGASPLKIAPPFRRLHERYPVDLLAEALAEGIVTGHPAMPAFQLDSDQIGDLIAYLKTLETDRR